jgi:D-arabinose 5-phosphate isomerase GutQ
VSLVCVTAERNSPLALNADIVLCIQVPGETDRNNEQGTTSFVVMCALFDALQAALIEETDYRSESFALIHPGGAVGKRLSGKKINDELFPKLG